MIETKLLKIPSNSPNRCKGIIPQGQCQYQASEGSDYCIMHGGAFNHVENAKVRNYRLQKWNRRVNELADSEGVKSLREEIGILRMILEEIINSCKDTTDLLLYSSKIADIVRHIERLVSSCHRMESSLGYMMDKASVLNVSQNIVQIISENIDDERKVDTIMEQIVKMIEAA